MTDVMMPTGHSDEPRPLRADARGNRRKLLDAARDVFIEHGPGAPLEEIARRAGTGIATLYRRFPGREALIRAVVVDAIERSTDEASRAAEEETDSFRALARYMHSAIDLRTAAVIPVLLGAVSFDDAEIARVRDAGPGTIEALVHAAQQAGALRPDVTAGDIGLLIVRLSRPLPGGFTAATNKGLSHRHLDVVLDGLRAAAQRPASLGGPAMTFDDLRELPLTPPSRPQIRDEEN
jgi:AcrR family transcriptional regulator